MYWNKDVELKELVGKEISKIEGLEKESDEVKFFTECGNEYMFYHEQDCCESVALNDFEGDAEDFKGSKILSAEEVVSEGDGSDDKWDDESQTWTFYKIETTKGGLWMRWLGQSNGYYSESVSLIWVNKPDIN